MNKICTKCNESKSRDEFFKSSRMKDGLLSQCKVCANEATRISRSKKADHYKALRKKNSDVMRKRYFDWKAEQGCQCCLREFDPCCLDLHHLDPSEKEADPSSLAGGSWARLMEEAAKCIVVCKNCHAKIHAGIIILPD